eukprot:SAG22_NODE_150_length_17426_cov_8.082588_15_plen_50_part_00
MTAVKNSKHTLNLPPAGHAATSRPCNLVGWRPLEMRTAGDGGSALADRD